MAILMLSNCTSGDEQNQCKQMTTLHHHTLCHLSASSKDMMFLALEQLSEKASCFRALIDSVPMLFVQLVLVTQ